MNKEILVKDNFLPRSFFNHLKGHLLSREIDWRYNWNATNKRILDETGEDYYFVHGAYSFNGEHNEKISPHFDKVQPVLYFIEDKFNFEIQRLMRMNFTFITQRNKNTTTQFHVDFDSSHYVAILYMNTCNGPTLIEDKQIDFIENRAVLFDGSMQHAAVTQTDSTHRINIVINIQGIFY
jgi:hypothetical protein